MSCQKGMRKFIPVLGFIVLCLSFSAAADDWGAPNPVSFNSRGFGYVAEIFPPHSRQNSTQKPLCYFYEVGYPGGTAWKIDAKLKWKVPRANDLMPYQAVVSMNGRLVTLNEYGTLGYKDAVAIYSQTGALVKTYQLDELIPASDSGKIETSMSSRWWNKDAKYYFLDNPGRLYVVLPWGDGVSSGHRPAQVWAFRSIQRVGQGYGKRKQHLMRNRNMGDEPQVLFDYRPYGSEGKTRRTIG
jgi:hypothetical protein